MLDNQREVEKREVKPRNIKYGDFDCLFSSEYVVPVSHICFIRRCRNVWKVAKVGIPCFTLILRMSVWIVSKSGDFNLILEAHEEMYGVRPALVLMKAQNIKGWESPLSCRQQIWSMD